LDLKLVVIVTMIVTYKLPELPLLETVLLLLTVDKKIRELLLSKICHQKINGCMWYQKHENFEFLLH
jgi:hypothetical protein